MTDWERQRLNERAAAVAVTNVLRADLRGQEHLLLIQNVYVLLGVFPVLGA